MKNHKLLTFNEDYADEMNVPALSVMTESEFDYWKGSKIELRTFMGNFEDGFDEKFIGCKTGQDFIDQSYVTVTDVSAEFAVTFNAAYLSCLSLCSIFER
jgi:hypothetical protein